MIFDLGFRFLIFKWHGEQSMFAIQHVKTLFVDEWVLMSAESEDDGDTEVLQPDLNVMFGIFQTTNMRTQAICSYNYICHDVFGEFLARG